MNEKTSPTEKPASEPRAIVLAKSVREAAGAITAGASVLTLVITLIKGSTADCVTAAVVRRVAFLSGGLVLLVWLLAVVYAVTRKRGNRVVSKGLALFLVIAPALLVTTGGWLLRANGDSRPLVVVANFDGPEAGNYRVTELLLERLAAEQARDQRFAIEALNRSITEQEGAQAARRIGERCRAAVVLWGWFAKTPQAAIVAAHYELSRPAKQVSAQPASLRYSTQVSELDSFELQSTVSGDMNQLVLAAVGVTLYHSGDYTAAVSVLTRSLAWPSDKAVDRSVPLFFRGTALALMKAPDYPGALSDLESAIRFSPNLVPAYGNAGNVYFAQRQYEQAVSLYTSGLQIAPDSASLLFNRASAYLDLGRRAEAQADLERAIQLRPTFADAYASLASLHLFGGETAKAEGYINQALGLNPFNAEAYYVKGLIEMPHSLAVAKNHLDRAIALHPGRSAYFSARGTVSFLQRDYKAAIADISQAIQLDGDRAEAYFNRGNAYLEDGQVEAAISDFDRAVAIDANYDAAYAHRASARFKKGELDKALSDYNIALQLNPKAQFAWVERGQARFNLGDVEGAIADFTEAVRLNPQNPEPYLHRGLAFLSSGQRELALSDYETLSRLTGSSPAERLLKLVKELPAADNTSPQQVYGASP